jgi:shikimate kinase/3-dehydroquinate synthase
MTRNLATHADPALTRDHSAALEAATLDRLDGRSVVMVGLMGAGKTTIGRRLAARLGLAFVDADQEIEQAAGCSVAELFDRFGEQEFRVGERRVIARVLGGAQAVVATGGGAVTDETTRRLIRERAVSVWLRCPLPSLVRRVSGRGHRPLLRGADVGATLERLLAERRGHYAEADVTVDCGEDNAETTTQMVLAALAGSRDPRRVHVTLARAPYDVVIGEGLIGRAGGLLGPLLAQRRCMVVTDETVAALHLPTLLASLAEAGIEAVPVIVPAGEASKRLEIFGRVVDAMLDAGVERRTTVVAFGGGVVGDLAGFAAATTLRGLPFVQIPTTLLAQVDSSVGGKTGINAAAGKNLVGAFHQPVAVLADIDVLSTLPARELRAGYAEIAKAGLIGDSALFGWLERNGTAVVAGDRQALAEAVERACAFKAAVIADDEREERGEDGRALLNLGHTFGHALETELGFDGRLLHGEAVAVGCVLAFALSARLGHCRNADVERVAAHMRAVGLPDGLEALAMRFSAAALIAHMTRDKKMRDGRLTFILAHAIGHAFTDRSVTDADVRALLIDQGCLP